MATVAGPLTIGPADHGRRMTLDEFIAAEFTGGWLYELARGVVNVTEVPHPNRGRTVLRLARLFMNYDEDHPGFIQYQAGGGECRIRLPGMQSDRHPDQALYLRPQPKGKRIWMRWCPDLVVEILSEGGEARDLIEKREEYLRIGVTEYWVIDRASRKMLVLSRVGDIWEEKVLGEEAVHRTHLLPGLRVRVGELLGPPDPDDEAEAEAEDD